jgi:hypothetical protein
VTGRVHVAGVVVAFDLGTWFVTAVLVPVVLTMLVLGSGHVLDAPGRPASEPLGYVARAGA